MPLNPFDPTRSHRAAPSSTTTVSNAAVVFLIGLFLLVGCSGGDDTSSSTGDAMPGSTKADKHDYNPELLERFRTEHTDKGKPLRNGQGDYSIELLDLQLKDVAAAFEEAFEAKSASKFCLGFTEDFRGSCPADLVATSTTGIAESNETDATLTNWIDGKKEFQSALQQYLDRFDIIYEAFFKMKEYDEDHVFENSVHCKLTLDLRGVRKDGATHQDFMKWKISLRKAQDTWNIDRLFVIERHQLASPKTMFREVTSAAGLLVAEPPDMAINGIGQIYTGDAKPTNFDYGGVCLYDVDGDGDHDIFMPNAYGPFALYMNQGDGTFREESRERGIEASMGARGAVFGDVDNDGDPDLFVARSSFHDPNAEMQGNLFFENLGEGRFREATKKAGLAATSWGMSPVFLDYDVDGDLDLFVANYGTMKHDRATTAHPYNSDKGLVNFLYQNDGNGKFTEVANAAGLGKDTYWSYAVAVCDLNGDRYPDLYVANDFGPNQFYVNQKDGTFVDRADELGIRDIGNGMGAAFADQNGDGLWDLYVTNMQSKTGQRVLAASKDMTKEEDFRYLWKLTLGNVLFEGKHDGTFSENRALDLGVANCGWAWNGDFADFDADGDEDLLVVNGYYSAEGTKDC